MFARVIWDIAGLHPISFIWDNSFQHIESQIDY